MGTTYKPKKGGKASADATVLPVGSVGASDREDGKGRHWRPAPLGERNALLMARLSKVLLHYFWQK
ncbi:hypothetical protein KTH89_23335 [Lachnospiraceae bacterium ASD5720]|uniref:Uncharacterized protein n=1 Tax=Diplocloster agilis TaxID=2850323 RepID=A0A949ND55_9FIRM|nr:hypothetical protein [Diplocloster agilis]